ncbi:MAG: 7,8-didemethyl-8-hydroxy-5-deazariboflavin synthase subunit CofG [Betaproteobacteria bacterium]|nr:7,8-didemethyl-8-hydroxy-5-deazariboflavin synthase subunit CofG [Betaproteobacteria bacterium]
MTSFTVQEANAVAGLEAERLEDVRSRARAAADAHWGKTVSYSRKVFIPLTTYCRNTCGYCTFYKVPGQAGARYMTPEEVLDVARKGERLGCKEALFSLGEKPELRYQEARAALAKLGYERTLYYLRDMCALVLRETSLIPHVNAGTATVEDLLALKSVSGSMGMMIENVSRRLTGAGQVHHACPDKTPVQRLRTLESAGKAGVPFTTGILIGIGETWEERIESLAAIDQCHRKYGHIQEVIVQNFRAKPGTPMANHPEPSLDDMERTLAVARLLLSPEISLQAPPNLEDDFESYLDCGINDLGGISPLTLDYINPERAWPAIAELARRTQAKGYGLQERLTVYPRYLKPGQGSRFLDPRLAHLLSRMAGPSGMASAQVLS